MVGRLSVTSDIGLHDPAQPLSRPQSVRVVPGRAAFQSRPRHMPLVAWDGSSGFHRTVTERAVKVAAILGLDKLKALGKAIHFYNP